MSHCLRNGFDIVEDEWIFATRFPKLLIRVPLIEFSNLAVVATSEITAAQGRKHFPVA
jgi:hypothetical protein